MITKDEFSKQAFATISEYPALEALYQAKDPRLFQHIDAIATMLSMFSQQLEVSQAEPFEKTKDSTVLADACMRGIIPKATPTTLSILISNEGGTVFEIGAGRVILDSSGRALRANNGAKIYAGQTAIIQATQMYSVETKHTVTKSMPFYEIPVSLKNEESMLCGIKVFDALGNEYFYTDRYSTAKANDRIFHIEVDERQNFYIRLGYRNVVGVQPSKGDIFTIVCYYTSGKIDSYSLGDSLTLDENQSVADAYIKMEIKSIDSAGENPISIELIRELAKYPSVYNKNAVYMGEFDFLVRSNFPEITFLAVWGESLEEIARGESVKNINCLFIAVNGQSGQEAFKRYDTDPVPDEITELTPLQTKIKELVNKADDSYRVRFYTPLTREIKINVSAKVSTSYDVTVVAKQIKSILLEKYGSTSIAMSKGRTTLLYKDLYELIKSKVQALQIGTSDLQIQVEDMSQYDNYPEIWHYLSENSIQVEISNINVSTSAWGVGF